jgi:hypothetical protein
VPGEPTYFLRTVVSSVAGAGNYALIAQNVEDVRTFAGQQVTVSFWAKADATKNITAEMGQYFGTGGSPSASVNSIGTTKVSIGTTFQKVTVTATVPSISGKTLGTDNNHMFILRIWFDAGSDFNGITDSLGHQSGTFDIAQVQVEAGPVATPFERRPIGTELALCQRYYEEQSVFSSYGTATFLSVCANYKVTKRVVPTTVVVDAAGNVDRVTALPVSGAAAVNNISQAASSGTVDFFRSTISGASGVYGGSFFTVKASAEL